jgi:hypothetical protein
MADTRRRPPTLAAPAVRSELETDGAPLLELVARRTEERHRVDGVVIGTLTALSAFGEPQVDFAANASPQSLRARSIGALQPTDVGREVALLFEDGDVRRPIVVGVMDGASRAPAALAERRASAPRSLEIDGDRVVLTGDKEVVLRCGKSSITLTRAGKIIIRGHYVSSHSSGVNRIKGGSVQIN